MTYVQTNRLASLTTSLGADTLLLVWMTGQEGVSQLFHYSVDVVSEQLDVAMDDLIGTDASVRLELADGSHRYFHGVVTQFEQGGADQRFGAYRLDLRPHLWLLTQRHDCRIFQGESVPDIVAAVLQGIDYEPRLSGTYQPLPYCVQYRESDFAFLSRLLEDAGIFYFFEHHEDRHVLVLADTPSAVEACPGQAAVNCAGDSGGLEAADEITGWRSRRRLHSGKVSMRDFNFEDPRNALEVQAATDAPVAKNSRLEVYDPHPNRYGVEGDGTAMAKVRMQELDAGGFVVEGESGCRAFVAGYKFKVQRHYVAAIDGREFLLTAVSHRLTQPSPFTTGAPGESVYENTFHCVPAEVPYRPARVTPRPRITGPQTAMVVGPAGEEIHVDKYGRVMVQFHWDRRGRRDEKSSCWVRVTQAWAGRQFGFVAHPRIGDEVIVEFLEGDPDSPIITGCVYNAQTMPPYELPANKTQTGVKTRSTKGGSAANFNEIRFEDKKGSEELYVHAEKDKKVVVEHDRTEDVGHDEKITIGNDRTEKVGANESITIGSNRTEKVGANESITVSGSRTRSVGGSESVTVSAARTHSVGANEAINVGAAQEVSVGGARALSVGGIQQTSIGGNHSESIGGSHEESIGKRVVLKVGDSREVTIGKADKLSAGKTITIEAGDELVIRVGKASISMKKDGTIAIEGKDINLKGTGAIQVKASKDVTIKGSKILEN